MKEIFKRFHSGRAIFLIMILILSILVGGVLKITAPVILPFTIAFLFAFALYPLIKLASKYHIPRFIAVIFIILIIIAGIYGLGVVLYNSGKVLVSTYPKYESRLTEIYIRTAEFLGFSYDEDLSFLENLWAQLGIRTWLRHYTLSFSTLFINFLKNAFLMVIFLAFLLIETVQFKEKIQTAFEGRADKIIQIGHDLTSQVSRYLTAKFLISLFTGIIFAIALKLLRVEFAIIWGILQFFFNFIPVFGSVVTGLGISLFSIIQFWPDPAPVILVIVFLLLVNIVIGNIMDPRIIGEHMGISPLVVLFSLVVWGWIWGFIGMIVAVPMMVIIKIICENIPVLEPVSILIGSRKAIRTLKP
ncbi:MAG: AI-2E family transporter [Treponema sp.]|nr:AI-2E family transporter [Treponema sp.]